MNLLIGAMELREFLSGLIQLSIAVGMLTILAGAIYLLNWIGNHFATSNPQILEARWAKRQAKIAEQIARGEYGPTNWERFASVLGGTFVVLFLVGYLILIAAMEEEVRFALNWAHYCR